MADGDVEAKLSKQEKKIREKQAKLTAKGIKTPYQGERKSFGKFHCFDCKNTWTSSHTWKEMAQQCEKCLKFIYPHNQWHNVKKKKEYKKQPAHATELCEKCQRLGRNCSKIFQAKKESKTAEKKVIIVEE